MLYYVNKYLAEEGLQLRFYCILVALALFFPVAILTDTFLMESLWWIKMFTSKAKEFKKILASLSDKENGFLITCASFLLLPPDLDL